MRPAGDEGILEVCQLRNVNFAVPRRHTFSVMVPAPWNDIGTTPTSDFSQVVKNLPVLPGLGLG